MTRSNLATSLRRRYRASSIAQYDRLPPELRHWLAQAVLPWSPQSVLRLWQRLIRDARGDTAIVLQRLDLAEQRMLAKDRPRVWGDTDPADPCFQNQGRKMGQTKRAGT
ncbi:DUF6525 family protein [Paracoccus sp. S3-43]|uniref:DUF6525 family protein n=1 Tax=Paracoccus sp. S3-43 TaxID=3030011 RepID=UPI0023AF0BFC|nr:DUF6525 family protein [Paracoccus sp. S3-43]WEF24879.1 DUF6525 family protein [Paracoccus sp. S3-43]